MTRNQLRERLAELIHEVWIDFWEEHKSWNCPKPEYPDYVMLPPATVARWDREAESEYSDLYSTEHQLEIADRYLEILDYYLAMNDIRSL